MERTGTWVRNGLAFAGALALGLWLGSARSAKAAGYDSSGNGVQFQLTGVDETSSLLVYEPGARTVYVYRGATVGNSALQCSYMYRLSRPGETIHRESCAVQNLNP